jgi:glutamate synthase (NADPH/NADH) large chain
MNYEEFRHVTIPMVFPVKEGAEGFKKALESILDKAEKAVDNKNNFIILSDRDISEEYAPIPSLLAVSAVHHHLIKAQKRMQIGILVETGEAREVSHFAMLLGYGASIINPSPGFLPHSTELITKGQVNMECYAEARHKLYIKQLTKPC